MEEIESSLYVDDLISGGETIDAALQVKRSQSSTKPRSSYTNGTLIQDNWKQKQLNLKMKMKAMQNNNSV